MYAIKSSSSCRSCQAASAASGARFQAFAYRRQMQTAICRNPFPAVSLNCLQNIHTFSAQMTLDIHLAWCMGPGARNLMGAPGQECRKDGFDNAPVMVKDLAQMAAMFTYGYYQLRQLRPLIRSMSAEAVKTLVQAFISCRLHYCN